MSEREIKLEEKEVKKPNIFLGRFKELFSRLSLFESKSAKMEKKYPKACSLVKAELASSGEYDEEYRLSKPIEKIKVADLSETTLKYLEDWDVLEFGLNSPNLKSAVLREIILRDFCFVSKAKSSKEFRSFLKKMNMSLEECIADLQSYVDLVVKASQLFRATDHRVLITHILDTDERWKSQFETGNSGGSLAPLYRSGKENRFFGFPGYHSDEAKTTDTLSPYHVSKRPIYGYFSPDANGILNERGTQPPPNVTNQYGRVHCKVKESKYTETTIAFGDTLFGQYGMTPFLKPHYTSLDFDSSDEPMYQYSKMFDIGEGKHGIARTINVANLHLLLSGYTETQIHNGLRMADIESLHVSVGNGLSHGDISELKYVLNRYNTKHPDSPVELIVY